MVMEHYTETLYIKGEKFLSLFPPHPSRTHFWRGEKGVQLKAEEDERGAEEEGEGWDERSNII